MKKLVIILSTMLFSLSAIAIPMSYGRPLIDLTKAFPLDQNKDFLIVAFVIPLIGLVTLGVTQFFSKKKKS